MKHLEGIDTEFKLTYVSDIKKEVVAFANSNGGTIFIGINDNGTAVGLENTDQTVQQVTNAIRDSIRPDITMFTCVTSQFIDDKSIVKIEVQRGTDRPYYLSDKGLKPSGVYVRQGSSSVPASVDAIRQMIKETDGDSFEKNRSLNQDLTFNTATEEMLKLNMDFGVAQQKTLGIIGNDNLYTNLGFLISDQCSHSIKIAIFQDTDKRTFRDRKEFHGSLLAQLRESYDAIDFYNSTKATFIGLDRKDERDYPPDAIREALLNAIVHRDYGFSGSTLINIYKNRIEFVSLGGLVPGLSLDAILIGISQSRNEKLAALFYRMRLIESYGTGIGKINNCYDTYPVKPTFEPVDGAFRVILPNIHSESNNNPPTSAKVSTNSFIKQQHKQILDIINKQGYVTRKDVEDNLGLKLSRSLSLLKEMTKLNLIFKTGSGKNTKYIIK